MLDCQVMVMATVIMATLLVALQQQGRHLAREVLVDMEALAVCPASLECPASLVSLVV